MLTRTSQLANIVGHRPHLVAKRAKNFADELVRSEFIKITPQNWLTDLPKLKGMFACGKCHICKFVDKTDTFTDADGQKTYQITGLYSL